MKNPKLIIKRRMKDGGLLPPLPEFATKGSAGMDLYAFCSEPTVLEPGGLVLIDTGISIELPENTVGIVSARSGLGVKHGITLSNGIGVIDSDYRGELKIGLCNVSDKPYTIMPSDRIAQLMVLGLVPVEIEERQNLSETERGQGGFGSTGR